MRTRKIQALRLKNLSGEQDFCIKRLEIHARPVDFILGKLANFTGLFMLVCYFFKLKALTFGRHWAQNKIHGLLE